MYFMMRHRKLLPLFEAKLKIFWIKLFWFHWTEFNATSNNLLQNIKHFKQQWIDYERNFTCFRNQNKSYDHYANHFLIYVIIFVEKCWSNFLSCIKIFALKHKLFCNVVKSYPSTLNILNFLLQIYNFRSIITGILMC